ncbi:MAG: hypothetical protein I3273_00215 [Candidatus Moeniiplasma glomeromycotorum]|nr:hypothetical protein [Candidatus Moeniiplasma glomeromycotorum]MCE8167447.1 hypothetical protein [Candidatus Moeniiplasma glomeromycotorum]MCE8168539.1 hypothetical protein [Candidatus Moeniiplasma glomeromycotorum]
MAKLPKIIQKLTNKLRKNNNSHQALQQKINSLERENNLLKTEKTTMREWENERMREWENERMRECQWIKVQSYTANYKVSIKN